MMVTQRSFGIVQLNKGRSRFDVRSSPSVPEDVRRRLMALAEIA